MTCIILDVWECLELPSCVPRQVGNWVADEVLVAQTRTPGGLKGVVAAAAVVVVVVVFPFFKGVFVPFLHVHVCVSL